MIGNCERCGKSETPVYTVVRGEQKKDVCPQCADRLGLMSGVEALDDIFQSALPNGANGELEDPDRSRPRRWYYPISGKF